MSRNYGRSGFSRSYVSSFKKRGKTNFKAYLVVILVIAGFLFLTRDIDPQNRKVEFDITENVKAGAYIK